jgi:hypothetical protein
MRASPQAAADTGILALALGCDNDAKGVPSFFSA